MATGEQKFSHAGTTYRFRMGWLAMYRYERLTGESAVQGLKAMEGMEKGDVFGERVVSLFHSGLEPQCESLEETAVLMDSLGSAEALAMIFGALEAGFLGIEDPDKLPTAETAEKKKRPQTKKA